MLDIRQLSNIWRPIALINRYFMSSIRIHMVVFEVDLTNYFQNGPNRAEEVTS